MALVCYLSDLIRVFLGDGQGGFVEHTSFPDPGWSSDIFSGDLNDDNLPDLITLYPADGVFAFFGDGTGDFSTPVELPAEYPYRGKPVTDDINSDNITDVVVSGWSDDLEIMFGQGDGAFNSPIVYNCPTGPRDLVAWDFNKDGNLDIAAATNGFNNYSNPFRGVMLFYGDGQGNFIDLD
jgi:hypothetical protein